MKTLENVLDRVRKSTKISDNPEIKEEKKVKYESILDNPNSKLWKTLNKIIIYLIIFSILILILETIVLDFSTWLTVGEVFKTPIFVLDWIISSIFAIEYFYRLSKAKSKTKFVKWPLNIIDLLAFLPFFLELLFAGLIEASFLKVLRIIRVFRVFKLMKHISIIWYIIKSFKNYKIEYQIAIYSVFVVVIIISVLMYYVEWGWRENIINEWFRTIPDGMWWAIVTMTSVGYWDVYPLTDLWKIMWSFIVIMWPVAFAMISSITVLVFLEASKAQDEVKIKLDKKECPRCKFRNSKVANYCMKCGEKYEEGEKW